MAMSDPLRKKMDELRLSLMEDLSQQELQTMQLKVDALMRLASMDGGHDHDTQGGVGHHDHNALADLSWRLEQPIRVVDVKKE
jgi:hypothetical protein